MSKVVLSQLVSVYLLFCTAVSVSHFAYKYNSPDLVTVSALTIKIQHMFCNLFSISFSSILFYFYFLNLSDIYP